MFGESFLAVACLRGSEDKLGLGYSSCAESDSCEGTDEKGKVVTIQIARVLRSTQRTVRP